MHLYDPVTFGESTPHNGDYVDCSPVPESGILAKIEGDTEILRRRTPLEGAAGTEILSCPVATRAKSQQLKRGARGAVHDGDRLFSLPVIHALQRIAKR